MDNFKDMSVKKYSYKQLLPKYPELPKRDYSVLDAWLTGQDERFIRKKKKIFEVRQ
jgi:hypothetical protein